jgi:hypothetical protein
MAQVEQRTANADHLDVSTWARQIILKALDRRESQRGSRGGKTAKGS